MKKKSAFYLLFLLTAFIFLFPLVRIAKADLFGADVVVLSQILVEDIIQVKTMYQMLTEAQNTSNVLEDMNRGVKDVIRLADSAHIQLPPQVYGSASQLSAASQLTKNLYGQMGNQSPNYTRSNYQSGVEGLYLSQDAFTYSNTLDDQGTKIKQASIVANQATATKLTAESVGTLIHAVDQSNRLEAKNLELNSTGRIEDTSKENAEFESFISTEGSIVNDMKNNGFTPLSIGED
jgi:hypothetical protein